MAGDTTARGYGWEHQKLRARLLPHAYGQPCSRCGEPMQYGQRLDLDHAEGKQGYRGFSHASCNRRAGQAEGVRRRSGRRGRPRRAAVPAQPTNDPEPRPVTDWGDDPACTFHPNEW